MIVGFATLSQAVQHKQAVIKSLAKSKNLNFDSGFYKNYLNILNHSVSECGNKFDIQTAEMVLFANAEDLSMQWC